MLIREALRYEEFRECLIRLIEEKNGVDPERDGFVLPTVEEESSSDGPDSDVPTVNARPGSFGVGQLHLGAAQRLASFDLCKSLH